LTTVLRTEEPVWLALADWKGKQDRHLKQFGYVANLPLLSTYQGFINLVKQFASDFARMQS